MDDDALTVWIENMARHIGITSLPVESCIVELQRTTAFDGDDCARFAAIGGKVNTHGCQVFITQTKIYDGFPATMFSNLF